MPLGADAPDLFAFIQTSCAACHNATVKSGDLDLKALQTAKTFEENREIWEKVAEKLQTGKMPPARAPRPPAETTTAVTGWLQSEFARQDSLVKPDAGHVSARRLNRAEYNNTIRDLLGVDIRPADNFPADTAAYGSITIVTPSFCLPSCWKITSTPPNAPSAQPCSDRSGSNRPPFIIPRPFASTIRAGALRCPRICSTTI